MLLDFIWINGRSGRAHWWLVAGLQLVALAFLVMAFQPQDFSQVAGSDLVAPLSCAALALWPGVVANIRRYHDRGKSGWWLLTGAVPLIGAIWQFVELGFLPGTPGDNAFGPPPGTPAPPTDFSEEIDRQPSRANGLDKVDDDYIEAYARRYRSAQQALLLKPVAAPANVSPIRVTASFGKLS